MSLSKVFLFAGLSLASAVQAQVQPAPATGATMVIVPAFGEVRHANDEATMTFVVEEQDKDRNAAASRVNQKMKQGTEIVRREDPQAELKTAGYFTYPVYPEVPEPPRPLATPPARRLPTGWRVGQYLEVTTRKLAGLPAMAAAAQTVLSISSVDYHLSPELTRRLDDQRIAETWRNLNQRIESIANAMGRKVSDAVIDTVDFEASGNYAAVASAPMAERRAAKGMMAQAIAEPSFEPGDTTLQMRVVGKVKFK
jgi:uncharacterized protein YggE